MYIQSLYSRFVSRILGAKRSTITFITVSESGGGLPPDTKIQCVLINKKNDGVPVLWPRTLQ